MSWMNGAMPVLFFCFFLYGLIKQVQYSVILQKISSAADRLHKRRLIGNHFYTFAFAGFVFLLLVNGFVYLGILPQTQTASNAVSLLAILFLVLMFAAKSAAMPKDQAEFLRSPKDFRRHSRQQD